jgi:hypothetical protein
MIRKIVVFAWLLLSMATPAVSYGQQKELNVVPFPCRIDPNDPERVLVDVLGTMSLQLGTDDIAGNAMSCLLKLRPIADGIVAEDLPTAFTAVMEQNPPVFFSFMAKNPKVFQEWLQDLPEVFTWFKNPPCLFGPKREQLISLLDHTKMREPRLESLKEQVIHKLHSIRCRQIQ